VTKIERRPSIFSVRPHHITMATIVRSTAYCRMAALYISLLVALLASPSFSYGPFLRLQTCNPRTSLQRQQRTMSDDTPSTSLRMTQYDTVRVDLADGRDYPIYIGTGYSDEQGTCMFSERNSHQGFELLTHQSSHFIRHLVDSF
jgi:hypothetical protein